MKVKNIKFFQLWLNAICKLDSRINVTDFNKLYKLFVRTHNV